MSSKLLIRSAKALSLLTLCFFSLNSVSQVNEDLHDLLVKAVFERGSQDEYRCVVKGPNLPKEGQIFVFEDGGADLVGVDVNGKSDELGVGSGYVYRVFITPKRQVRLKIYKEDSKKNILIVSAITGFVPSLEQVGSSSFPSEAYPGFRSGIVTRLIVKDPTNQKQMIVSCMRKVSSS